MSNCWTYWFLRVEKGFWKTTSNQWRFFVYIFLKYFSPRPLILLCQNEANGFSYMFNALFLWLLAKFMRKQGFFVTLVKKYKYFFASNILRYSPPDGQWCFSFATNRQLAICHKAKTPLAIWRRVAEDVTCEEVLEFFHEFNRKSLFSHEFRL